MDFQDFVNPVFRIELALNPSTKSGLPDTLDFNRKEGEILEEIDLWFDRVVKSFNDFIRPEFAKVKLVSRHKYEEELEEEARLRKLNFQVKKAAVQSKSSQTSFVGGQNITKYVNKNIDFEGIFYGANEDGANMYRKYMGRIQIQESPKDVKDIVDDNNLNVFSRPFVEKRIKVTDPDEECFKAAKGRILKKVKKQIRDAKRVYELFAQFEPLIRGTLTHRVRDFVEEDRREQEYEGLIKEIRYYEKLAQQLPSIVFFPMFEVGVQRVKQQLQDRASKLLKLVF